ncbi:MAG: cupin domain-containing protein [Ignavibacteria bacterium]|nr:cupin domain-containing protein [Ignavibacteria bacterium]
MQRFSEIFIEAEKTEWIPAGEGMQRKILAFNNSIMMVLVDFQAGATGYLHTHPHDQVSYVVSGKFVITIGESKKELKAGDSFLMQSGVEHGVHAIEQGQLLDVFAPYREDFLPQL